MNATAHNNLGPLFLQLKTLVDELQRLLKTLSQIGEKFDKQLESVAEMENIVLGYERYRATHLAEVPAPQPATPEVTPAPPGKSSPRRSKRNKVTMKDAILTIVPQSPEGIPLSQVCQALEQKLGTHMKLESVRRTLVTLRDCGLIAHLGTNQWRRS